MRKIIDALLVFIVGLAITLLLGPVVYAKYGVGATGALEIAFLILPVLLCIFKKESIKERFSLNLPTVRDFFGALIVFIGTFALSYQASLLIEHFFDLTNETDAVFYENYLSGLSPAVALILLALIPAICEEMLYRGYILNSFRKTKTKVILPIIISSLLFSAAHLDLYKAIPVLIIGVGFGIIAVLSDSILLTVIAHFVNNALSLISYYEMQKYATEETLTLKIGDVATVAISAVGIIFGILMIMLGVCVFKRKRVKGWIIALFVGAFITSSVGCIAVAGMSELGTVKTDIKTQSITATTTVNESFTLDKDTVCFPCVVAYGDDYNTKCTITITDSKGNEVVSATDSTLGYADTLEKGEYNIEIKFELPEGEAKEQKVTYDISVLTFAEITKEKPAQ